MTSFNLNEVLKCFAFKYSHRGVRASTYESGERGDMVQSITPGDFIKSTPGDKLLRKISISPYTKYCL